MIKVQACESFVVPQNIHQRRDSVWAQIVETKIQYLERGIVSQSFRYALCSCLSNVIAVHPQYAYRCAPCQGICDDRHVTGGVFGMVPNRGGEVDMALLEYPLLQFRLPFLSRLFHYRYCGRLLLLRATAAANPCYNGAIQHHSFLICEDGRLLLARGGVLGRGLARSRLLGRSPEAKHDGGV